MPTPTQKLSSDVNAFKVRLKFHDDLTFFLKAKANNKVIERILGEKTSVKDVIEAVGVPHTEIDLIVADGEPLDFSFQIEGAVDLDVYPFEQTPNAFPEKRLQTRAIARFIADGHLGKLVRDFRLLGFDVLYDCDAQDRQLIDQLKIDNGRALLTRDRRLLMHSVVEHGYYLRSQDPLEQTIEVLLRFDLFRLIDPFTRCLRCNAGLEKAEKNSVIEKLEPLTKIYYEQFRRCTGCGQIYWAGSHFSKLQRRLEKIRECCS